MGNLDELILTLKESRLPKEYQLAVKLLGDYYFTLADYALTYLVTAADVDNDKKITLAEITGMADVDVAYYLVKVFTNMVGLTCTQHLSLLARMTTDMRSAKQFWRCGSVFCMTL